MTGTDAVPPGDGSLVPRLAEYLRDHRPRFLVVVGSVGAGKSSLVRALYAAVEGPKILTLYQQPILSTEDGASHARVGGATTVLLADPNRPPGAAADDAAETAPPVATGARGTPGIPAPAPLANAVLRLQASGAGTAFVDSWDADTERFAQELVGDPEALRPFPIPATEFGALQSTLLGLRVNLVLALIPEMAAPLQSFSDALLELREETRSGARVRIASVPKIRGTTVDAREYLYTLDGGRFRSFPDLPPGFVPPTMTPDADPDPDPGAIWPGSTAFATQFGRLRHGGLTAMTLAPDTSDAWPTSIAQPMVSHVLRAGGRVVWMPAPSVRPSKIVALLRDRVPPEWLRERLRVISASGDDPTLGELASVVLPLRREVGVGGGDVRAATSPGVGPIFPDAHRFLRLTPDGSPALYVLSVEGLKAGAAAAGIALNTVTLPAVLAAYAKLPRFHGFGYGQADDPVAGALLPMVSTLLHLQVVGGRPILHGLRPRTPAFVLEWPTADAAYSLTPAR